VKHLVRFIGLYSVLHLLVFAQGQVPPAGGQQERQRVDHDAAAPSQLDQLRANYTLRSGDQIVIRAFEMEEISDKPFRVDSDGSVTLPVLGPVKGAGLTVGRLEESLSEMLKKYVRVPQVSITVTAFASEPVFFVGAFKAPGIYSLSGRRTLLEMITAIGGLQPSASRRIRLTRRVEFGRIPLSNSVVLADNTAYTAEINIAQTGPEADIDLQPFDVVNVQKAEMIYVNGQVAKTGGLELQDRDTMSVMQAIALSGGLTPEADTRTAYILRPVLDTTRRASIPLKLDKILAGREVDRPLQSNDVLYIPKESGFKRNIGKVLLVGLPVAASILSISLLLAHQ
jgi:polysaccharide export outer membrane protein